jgi:hypothetical protein
LLRCDLGRATGGDRSEYVPESRRSRLHDRRVQAPLRESPRVVLGGEAHHLLR